MEKQTINYGSLQKRIGFAEFRNELKVVPLNYIFSILLQSKTRFLVILILIIPLTLMTIFNSVTNAYLISGLIVFVIILFFLLSLSIYLHLKSSILIRNFCQDNKFKFELVANSNEQNGMIFDRGDSRIIKDKISGIFDGKQFWVGNYNYSIGHSKSRQTYSNGIISLEMPKVLPNIYLESKSDATFSNWYSDYKKNQIFDLEGDFNEYFVLYAPAGYETEMLYFMTPDFMQLLINKGQGFALETVGNEIKIYNKRGAFDFNEATLKTIFEIINTIGAKLAENTELYEEFSTAALRTIDSNRNLKKPTLSTAVNISITIIGISIGLAIAFILS